jgi:hypothetical protein
MTLVRREGSTVIEEADLSEGFSVFTIYEYPLDFPQHYVVRESVALGGIVYFHLFHQLADTLEDARKLIPSGRVCLSEPNTPELPAVESWI